MTIENYVEARADERAKVAERVQEVARRHWIHRDVEEDLVRAVLDVANDPRSPAEAIRRIEAQCATPPTSFSLDAAETAKARAWCDEHDQKHPGGDGAIGGRYTYSFTPTTLGVVAKVTCACGGSVDLTNYEEW